MELNISNIDIVVILLFVVGIIWWALKNRKNENASEYFLAGKSQNWFVVGSHFVDFECPCEYYREQVR